MKHLAQAWPKGSLSGGQGQRGLKHHHISTHFTLLSPKQLQQPPKELPHFQTYHMNMFSTLAILPVFISGHVTP